MPQLRTAFRKTVAPAVHVAGIGISHPERLIAEAPEHTKLDVVRYHERIGRWLVPQLAPRPIAAIPTESGSAPDAAVATRPDAEESELHAPPPFIRVSDVADVVRAVQNGQYEFRTWGASFPRLERPDRITLALDPGAEVAWPVVQDAARAMHALLDSLGLPGFVKTTGGSGLHFVVPITRRHTWVEAGAFAGAVGMRLASQLPALFVATADHALRTERVYVDSRRNAEGVGVVAAYSLRSRPGLPVSMPIAWDDLDGGDVRGRRFDIDTAEAAIARRRADPWADYERSRQTISASMRRALGI